MMDGKGNLLVIKVGGNALVTPDAMKSFAQAVRKLLDAGYLTVISHGGGPQISAAFEAAGEPSEFVGGFRFTTAAGALLVKQVLCQEIQTQIVHELHRLEVVAKGICGDQNVFSCVKRTVLVSGEKADLGYVGEIISVDDSSIKKLIDENIVPIVSAIGTDPSGNLYNINADTGAAELAVAINADYLVLLTDVDGVYGQWPNKESLLNRIDPTDLLKIASSSDKGMAPKLEAANIAVSNGVKQVVILNGNTGTAIEKYFIQGNSIGTTIS